MSDTLKTVTDVLQAYVDAVRNKDADAFAGIYHPQVRVFDAWDAWTCCGRSAVREMASNWFQMLGENRIEVAFSQVQGYVGSGLAAASALATYTALAPNGERLRSQVNRISLVLQQEPGGWLVVHEHTSVPVGFTSKQAVPFVPAEGDA